MFKKQFIIGSNSDDEIRTNDIIVTKSLKNIHLDVSDLKKNFDNINKSLTALQNNIVTKSYYSVTFLNYPTPTPPTPTGDPYYDTMYNIQYSLQLSIKKVSDKIDELIENLINAGILKEEVEG